MAEGAVAAAARRIQPGGGDECTGPVVGLRGEGELPGRRAHLAGVPLPVVKAVTGVVTLDAIRGAVRHLGHGEQLRSAGRSRIASGEAPELLLRSRLEAAHGGG